MYIDVITGLVLGLLILAAREFQNWKKLKEADRVINLYQAQGRELTVTKNKLAEAIIAIDKLRENTKSSN